MKVGDYVRIKEIIRKIDTIGYQDDTYISFTEDNTTLVDKSIIKSSPNIIDLIEVGDYVNGRLVKDKNSESTFVIVETSSIIQNTIFKEDIKSILTKEQFESMEYRIGE